MPGPCPFRSQEHYPLIVNARLFALLGITVSSPGTCVDSTHTACLQGGRFRVEAGWRTPELAGPAQLGVVDGDSATFWFFDSGNTELTVKVLDACVGFDRFWVFASGPTNVEVTLTVTDTETGRTRRYFNPQGKVYAPVQDVGAFATCP